MQEPATPRAARPPTQRTPERAGAAQTSPMRGKVAVEHVRMLFSSFTNHCSQAASTLLPGANIPYFEIMLAA